jgi:flagellar assembly protein FliH
MSSIIKASAGNGERPVEYAFDDLGDPSRAELQDAGRRAAQLLAEAETQASQLCRLAEQQGRAAAQAAAEQDLNEKVGRHVHSLVPALGAAVDEIHVAKAQWLAHWEKAALDVATAIAARIIRREVERTPDITIALVKEALELAAGSADVQLRMHPDDLAALGSRVERLIGELGRLGDAKVVADADITRGGCRLDTRFGAIDQQFDSQLARIAQELI